MNARRRLRWGAGLGAVALAGAAACVVDPLPADDACEDIAYSFANRVYQCSGDPGAADDAYDAWRAQVTCTFVVMGGDVSEGEVAPSPAQAYQCSGAIRAVACEAVLAEDFASRVPGMAGPCGGGLAPRGPERADGGT